MDHVAYLDAKSKELEKLLDGQKTMIVRGAAGRKLPYGRVNSGDILWFMENNGDGLVKAHAAVKSVFNSEKLTADESVGILADNQHMLQLNDEQLKLWSGKRYLVLIEVDEVHENEPFAIDRSGYANMDDWLPVGDIYSVRL